LGGLRLLDVALEFVNYDMAVEVAWMDIVHMKEDQLSELLDLFKKKKLLLIKKNWNIFEKKIIKILIKNFDKNNDKNNSKKW
jgi:hypothetical protein